MLIVFPRQQWLRERASLLHYAYVASDVYLTQNILKENENFCFKTSFSKWI